MNYFSITFDPNNNPQGYLPPNPNWHPAPPDDPHAGSQIQLGTELETNDDVDFLDPQYLGTIDGSGNVVLSGEVLSQATVMRTVAKNQLNNFLANIANGAYQDPQGWLTGSYEFYNRVLAQIENAELRAKARVLQAYNNSVAKNLDNQHSQVLSAIAQLQGIEQGITKQQSLKNSQYMPPVQTPVVNPNSSTPVAAIPPGPVTPTAPSSGVAPLVVGAAILGKVLLF